MTTSGDNFNVGYPNPRKWQAYDASNGKEKYGWTDTKARHKYSSEQATLIAGSLVIKAERLDPLYWKSAFLGSREAKKWYPLYGTFKFRAVLPQASGIWPGLWLRHKKGATVGEVDIAEVFFAGGDQVSQTLHFPSTVGKNVFAKGMKLTPGVHNYWAKIAPDGSGVKFTLGVDTRVAGTYRHPNRAALEKDISLEEGWDVAINLAVSDGRWTGSQAKTVSPQVMSLEWFEWSSL